MLMPRLPVDGKKVVEHRVTLGAKERELLGDATTAYTVNRIATPIVAALSDGSFVLLLGALIGYQLDKILDPDWRAITQEMTPAQLRDWLETQNIVGGSIGSFLGFLIGVPFGGVGGLVGAAVGGLAGSAAVEVGEAGVELAGDVLEENLSPGATIGIVSGIIGLMNTLESLGTALQPGGSEN